MKAELGIAGGADQGALDAGSDPSDHSAPASSGATSTPNPTPAVPDLEPPPPGADQGAP